MKTCIREDLEHIFGPRPFAKEEERFLPSKNPKSDTTVSLTGDVIIQTPVNDAPLSKEPATPAPPSTEEEKKT